VTWKQAAHALSDPDSFAESIDPFYVPGRTREAVSFVAAVPMAALVLCAPPFVPLTKESIGLLLGLGLFAALAFYRGWQARRYRLSRTRAVTELRARLLTEGES
jgi:hypothetical protein